MIRGVAALVSATRSSSASARTSTSVDHRGAGPARAAASLVRAPRRRTGTAHRGAEAQLRRCGHRLFLWWHRRDSRRPHAPVRRRRAWGPIGAASRSGEGNPRAIRRRHHAAAAEDGGVPRWRADHSQSVQPHTGVLGGGPPFRARFPADVAHGRVVWIPLLALLDSQRWGEGVGDVYGLAESTIAPLMEEVNAKYRGLKAFSLPSMGEGGARRHIELGVRGVPDEVGPAMERLRRGIDELGGTVDIPNR